MILTDAIKNGWGFFSDNSKRLIAGTLPAIASGLVAGGVSNEQYYRSFLEGVEKGANYKSSNGSFTAISITGGSLDAVTSPVLGGITTGAIAYLTLEAAWHFAKLAAKTNQWSNLTKSAIIILSGTAMILYENRGILDGAPQIDGFINGFDWGYRYGNTNPDANLSLLKIDSSTAVIVSLIAFGGVITGAAINYRQGMKNKDQGENDPTVPLIPRHNP